MLIQNNVPVETVRLLEAGVNKHLNKSFRYKPLRYFYRKFQRNNPQTVANARDIVAQDIAEILSQMMGYNEAAFVVYGNATEAGKLFFKRVYNIGINLLKKRLTVMQAFRVISNPNFRMQVYDFILKSVQKAANEFMQKDQIDDQSKG